MSYYYAIAGCQGTLFGLIPGIPGTILYIWTLHALGLNITDTVQRRKFSYIVTTGPYNPSVARIIGHHPMYFADVLLVITVTMLTSSIAIAISGGIMCMCLYWRSRREAYWLRQ